MAKRQLVYTGSIQSYLLQCGNTECIRHTETILYKHPEISISHGGGCMGHDSGEYCYCDSPYTEIEWKCRECKAMNKTQT